MRSGSRGWFPDHRAPPETGGRGRGGSTVDVVPVAGVNHLLVPAVTGGVAEYDTLPDKQVAPRVAEALIAWIGNAIP